MTHKFDETPLVVFENNDAAVQLKITKRQVDGTLVKYPFDNAGNGDLAEFYLKTNFRDADGSALATYTFSAGDITDESDASNTVLQVQMSAADLATAGEYFYHLDVLEGGTLRKTVAYGPIEVRNL